MAQDGGRARRWAGSEARAPARVGPTVLQSKFDTAQKRWAKALRDADVAAIAQGFREISAAITQIADAVSDSDAASRESPRKTG